MKIKKKKVKRWIYDHISIQAAEGGLLPMRFTPIQSLFFEKSRALELDRHQDYVVKPRQVGLSTVNMCFIMACMVLYHGFSAIWVSQDEDNAKIIRRKWDKIVDSAIASIGSGISKSLIKRRNDTELVLVNGSSVSFTYAGDTEKQSKSTGRGDTIQFAVFTESAYWPHAATVYEALIPGAELAKPSIVWDSTPNGTAGDGEFFYTRVMACLEGRLNGFVHFWPWWLEKRYSTPCSSVEEKRILKTLTPFERHLMDHEGVSIHQIKWRRLKIEDMPGGLTKFREAYIETMEDAFIVPGKTVFDTVKLAKYRRRMQANPTPTIDIKPYLVEKGLDIDDYNDPLLQVTYDPRRGTQARFYIPPTATKHGPFTLGCDTSTGVKGGDYSSFVMLDKNANVAGVIRGLFEPVVAACLISRIQTLYNAFIYIEDQSTGPEISRILRSEMSKADIRKHGLHPIMSQVFLSNLVRNNPSTRPALIATLIGFINKGFVEINDVLILSEAFTFVRNSDGKIEHANNCNDDSLLALAFALKGRDRVLIESSILEDITEEDYGESYADRHQYVSNNNGRVHSLDDEPDRKKAAKRRASERSAIFDLL